MNLRPDAEDSGVPPVPMDVFADLPRTPRLLFSPPSAEPTNDEPEDVPPTETPTPRPEET